MDGLVFFEEDPAFFEDDPALSDKDNPPFFDDLTLSSPLHLFNLPQEILNEIYGYVHAKEYDLYAYLRQTNPYAKG